MEVNIFVLSSDRVKHIGSVPTGHSSNGVEQAGSTFLTNDVPPSNGVVFAFTAYFRAKTKVQFQFWRPVSTFNGTVGMKSFILLASYDIMPRKAHNMEDVSMEDSINYVYIS